MNTQKLALISVLTAVCLGIQLLPRPMNIEFTSLITFVTGVMFGGFFGALLGTLVMFVNGFLSSYGFAGVVLPFQIVGMVIIGGVGGLYAKMGTGRLSAGLMETAVLGAFLTFVYDVVTNVGTAVWLTLSGVPFPQACIVALISGAIPSVIHVGWNASLFFAVTVPLMNAMQKTVMGK